jgi:hypothetical protein
LVVKNSHGDLRSCEEPILNEHVRKKIRPHAKIFKICPENIRPRQFGIQKFVQAAILIDYQGAVKPLGGVEISHV